MAKGSSSLTNIRNQFDCPADKYSWQIINANGPEQISHSNGDFLCGFSRTWYCWLMAARNRSLRARNKTTTIGTSALIALGGIGCGRTTTPAPTASSASVIVDSSASAEPSSKKPDSSKEESNAVVNEFARYAVTLPNIARRTLYSWTKIAQIDELEKNPTLLTRSDSPEHGTSYFEQVLEQRAQKMDPLAKLLRTTAFARQRYAWPAPFATREGTGGESYGDELIQIDLKLAAWFVILKMSSSELTVVDMDNKPVPIADALAQPERLAAAYFVQDQPATGYRASMAGPNERIGYREYVLINESMIASYSVGTPEIQAEWEKEIETVERFRHYLATHEGTVDSWPKWMIDVVKQTWVSPVDTLSPIKAYEAALAFTDYPYYPEKSHVERLIVNFRATRVQRSNPITHVPTFVFPSASTSAPAARPRIVAPSKHRTF
jgi:hypothetical protein